MATRQTAARLTDDVLRNAFGMTPRDDVHTLRSLGALSDATNGNGELEFLLHVEGHRVALTLVLRDLSVDGVAVTDGAQRAEVCRMIHAHVRAHPVAPHLDREEEDLLFTLERGEGCAPGS